MDIQKDGSAKIENGRDIAKYLIYFSKLKNPRLNHEAIKLVNISGIACYRKHKKNLDRLYLAYEKYGFDIVKYLKFFVSRFNFTDENISKIVNAQYLLWYAENEKAIARNKKIYSYVMKSVDNIVEECVENGYSDTKEYLKNLIKTNKLGEKYLSGKISQYYLAGIKNIRKIISTMDEMNQDTLSDIVKNKEKIESDLQDAFTMLKSSRISIISFTNEQLCRRLGIS